MVCRPGLAGSEIGSFCVRRQLGEIAIKHSPGPGIAPPLREAEYPHDTYPPIERDRDHVMGPHQPAWRGGTFPVEPHQPRSDKFGGSAACAHYPRMPQPPIDSLAIQSSSGSAPLLTLGFKLGFQCRKLGEGRIRIRDLLAPLLRPWLCQCAAIKAAVAPRQPILPGTLRLLVLRAVTLPALLAMRRLGTLRRSGFRRSRHGVFCCASGGRLLGMTVSPWFAMTRAFRRTARTPYLDKGLLFRRDGRRCCCPNRFRRGDLFRRGYGRWFGRRRFGDRQLLERRARHCFRGKRVSSG